MTERTKRSLITVALLALGVTAVIMSLTIVGFIGRAHAQADGLPENPTTFFVQLYQFIKNGEHLPAVGVGLMLFVWFLRWAHEKLPAPIGPFFKTKLGGYILGFGTAFNVYLGTALIADQPWTFGLLMQALGVGFAASGKWEGLMDVLKKAPKVSSTIKNTVVGILLASMLVSPLLTGCNFKEEAKFAGKTTLDCTVGELADLAGLVPTILPILGEKPDWKVVQAQLEQAGGRVGLCVFASLVDRWTTTTRLATPETNADALDTLAAMKAKYNVGAVKTTAGVR